MIGEFMLDLLRIERENDKLIQSQVRAACMIAFLIDNLRNDKDHRHAVQLALETLEEIAAILQVRIEYE
jgi:hypothetical protein